MSVTVNWTSRIVLSTASINDLPAFEEELRLLEASATGMLYPPICTYKKLDLGGGAFFHAVDFINDYVLQFVGAGPFTVTGNLGCTIVATGVHVERTKAAAFATTAIGGGGLPPEQEALLRDIAKIHGLVLGTPLVVTPTSRSAGDVSQSIGEAGGVVTVTRSP